MSADMKPQVWTDHLLEKHECGSVEAAVLQVRVGDHEVTLVCPQWLPAVEILCAAQQGDLLFVVGRIRSSGDKGLDGDGAVLVGRRGDHDQYAVHVWHALYPQALNHLCGPSDTGEVPQNGAADLDQREAVVELLVHLHAALPALEALLAEVSSHWGYQDPIYRFYHQSFKLYALQAVTERIVETLQSLAPRIALNGWFTTIMQEGTGKVFENAHNKEWLNVTRPMVEAFFHARYFLEMAVCYGRQLEAPPAMLPSGWAALLYLYNLR